MNHDQVRLPEYIRATRSDFYSNQECSVGDVLRIARKKLIVRQLVLFLIFIFLAVLLVFFFVLGYADWAIKVLSDRLLG